MILILLLLLSQEQGLKPQEDSLQQKTENRVEYRAEKIVYDIDRSIVILYDSSTILYKDIELRSDSAYYHIKTDQLEAFGNCDLRQVNDSIKGEYLRYNIETKKAVMYNGRTQIDKGFLEGKRIYWIDEHTVNAYQGKYTTCSDSPPHYYFYSPRMKIYLGDMVIARPIVLFVEGFPVLAAPFWFVPISSKRKSGLLPFKAGNSRNYGKYLRGLAYYLVISDYADATFQIDAFEKKGIMPQFEGIWNFAPFSKGNVYGSYIKETDTQTRRYELELRNNSEYFLFGSNFNCDLKYVSDNSYRQDFTDTTVLWLEKEILSQATLARSIGALKNTIFYERKETFIDTSASTIEEKIPYYTLSTPSKTLFSLVSYSFSGHINRNRTIIGDSTKEAAGANINTTPAMQQNILGLFTLSPHLNMDLAVFDKDTSGERFPVRFGYSFGANAGTNLYRLFNIEFLGVHGILHKVLPKVSYTFTPDFDFGRFPLVPGIPGFTKTNSFGFGVDQVFEAKIGMKKEKKVLAQLGIFSGYNLDTDSLSDITWRLELPYNPFPTPITKFTSNLNGSVDPYTYDYFYTINNSIGLKTDFFSLNLNQRYTKDDIYQIWLNGGLKPTPYWVISYSARYDWDKKEFVDYRFGLTRDLHCWEAVFNFNQLGDAWRYDFEVRIKEIPDVTIGKGLLGYILE